MTATSVVFGDVEVDFAGHEIRVAGSPVPVEPQVFDVLSHLIRHRDRLVPKTELLDEVWGDRFVSESALTSRIKAARRAVGDNGRDQRVIRTVHGRGYRFVAEVGVERSSGPEGASAAPGELGRLVADLRAGRGSATLVVADPGPARRELLDDLFEDAAAAGLLAARGRVERLGPLAGVAQLLDEVAQHRPEALAAVPEACRAELRSVTGGGAPSTLGRLQLAARELLVAASAEGPVLAVLHDAELVDPATRTLLEAWAGLTRRHPFGLVVAHRDPGALAGFTAVEPAGLQRRPTDRYVPELPEEVVQALTRLALAGEGTEVAAFGAVAGLDAVEADRALDIALGAGVVGVDGDRVAFTSAGDADDLVRRLGPHRRAELHREVAEALAGAGAPPAVVARQHLAGGDAAAAGPFALEAARRAAAVHDHGEVLSATAPVLDHLVGDERVEALALRAMSLVATGDPSAPRLLREALATADPTWAVFLRLGLAQASILSGDIDGAAEALEGLEPDGGSNDGALLLLRGMVAFFRGDLEAADRAAADARGLALAPGAPGVLLDVIALQGMIAHNRGEWFDRMRRELRATQDDPVVATKVFDGQLCVAEFLLYGPMPYAEVVELARGLQSSAARSGARRAEAFALCLAGEAQLLAGHLEEARADLTASVELHRELRADAGTAHSLQRLAEVELAEGDPAAAERLAREALGLARWSPLARHLVQRTYGTLVAAAPDTDAALEVLVEADLAADDNSRCEYCDIMLSVPATMAFAAAGRLDEARVCLARAQRSAERWHGTAWEGAVLEAEAAVTRAEDRAEEADALFEQAATRFDRAGQPLDAARCREAVEGVGV